MWTPQVQSFHLTFPSLFLWVHGLWGVLLRAKLIKWVRLQGLGLFLSKAISNSLLQVTPACKHTPVTPSFTSLFISTYIQYWTYTACTVYRPVRLVKLCPVMLLEWFCWHGLCPRVKRHCKSIWDYFDWSLFSNHESFLSWWVWSFPGWPCLIHREQWHTEWFNKYKTNVNHMLWPIQSPELNTEGRFWCNR